MAKNSFFNLTPLYKEFMILDYLDKDPNITQRMISKYLGISVSMVNSYIDSYEKKGYVKREYISQKNVKYIITKRGMERRKVLNIGFLNASQKVYSTAKENILSFVEQIVNKGFRNILLYGAGEVAEILLQVIKTDKSIPLDALAVIDDDHEKQNQVIVNTPIVNSVEIKNIKHDGILISSYTNNEIIRNKLISLNYKKENILSFFDI